MALPVLAISQRLIHDDCVRVKLLFGEGFDVYDGHLFMTYISS